MHPQDKVVAVGGRDDLGDLFLGLGGVADDEVAVDERVEILLQVGPVEAWAAPGGIGLVLVEQGRTADFQRVCPFRADEGLAADRLGGGRRNTGFGAACIIVFLQRLNSSKR